jgi:hypothetical protein
VSGFPFEESFDMSRRQSLQIYLPPDLDHRVREAAAAGGDTISGWLRGALARACDAPNDAVLARLERDLIFATVALDALLLADADDRLRERTLKAFTRKIERRARTNPALEGARNEA